MKVRRYFGVKPIHELTGGLQVFHGGHRLKTVLQRYKHVLETKHKGVTEITEWNHY
jgi:hypothetical protein